MSLRSAIDGVTLKSSSDGAANTAVSAARDVSLIHSEHDKNSLNDYSNYKNLGPVASQNCGNFVRLLFEIIASSVANLKVACIIKRFIGFRSRSKTVSKGRFPLPEFTARELGP